MKLAKCCVTTLHSSVFRKIRDLVGKIKSAFSLYISNKLVFINNNVDVSFNSRDEKHILNITMVLILFVNCSWKRTLLWHCRAEENIGSKTKFTVSGIFSHVELFVSLCILSWGKMYFLMTWVLNPISL